MFKQSLRRLRPALWSHSKRQTSQVRLSLPFVVRDPAFSLVYGVTVVAACKVEVPLVDGTVQLRVKTPSV